MAIKAVSQCDLDTLELKITKEQQQIRHNKNNELQKYYNIVDDLKTDSALSKQSFINMTNSIEKLELMMIKEFWEIKEEIKSIKSGFVTKQELEPIKEKQKSHDDTIAWVVRGIVVGFISLIAWLVWLSKYM